MQSNSPVWPFVPQREAAGEPETFYLVMIDKFILLIIDFSNLKGAVMATCHQMMAG